MHSYILGSVITGASPEAKYLLARLVQRYGIGMEASWKVKELAKEVGLSDRLVSRSVSELQNLGILSRTKERQDARGGPTYRYEITLGSLVGSRNGTGLRIDPLREQQLDELLAAEGVFVGVRLTALNKLLWAVLLLHADKFGVVRDLGLSDIANLTGFTRDRIKGQLAKLYAMSALRYLIPGLTEPGLFGVVKGRYYLNLNHQALCKQGEVSLIFLSGGLDGRLTGLREVDAISEFLALLMRRSEKSHIERMLERWRRKMDSDMPSYNEFCAVAKFFSAISVPVRKGYASRLGELLQCRLEEYASVLLSGYRVRAIPTASPYSGFCESHIEVIKGDLRRSGASQNEDDLTLLSLFIFKLSFIIARRYSGIIDEALTKTGNSGMFEGMDFLILPNFNRDFKIKWGRVLSGVHNVRPRIAPIISFHREGADRVTATFSSSVASDGSEIKTYSESELPKTERVENNLQGEQKFPLRYGVFPKSTG